MPSSDVDVDEYLDDHIFYSQEWRAPARTQFSTASWTRASKRSLRRCMYVQLWITVLLNSNYLIENAFAHKIILNYHIVLSRWLMKPYTRLRIINVNQKSAANLENPITLQCGPQQALLPNNQTNNQTNKQTNNQTNKQKNNQTDQQTNDQIDKRTERLTPSTRSSVKQVCNVRDKKEETTKWKDETNKGQWSQWKDEN